MGVVLMLVLDLPLVLAQVDLTLAVILELHLTTIGELIPITLVLDQIIGDQILETLVQDLICMGDQCPMDPFPQQPAKPEMDPMMKMVMMMMMQGDGGSSNMMMPMMMMMMMGDKDDGKDNMMMPMMMMVMMGGQGGGQDNMMMPMMMMMMNKEEKKEEETPVSK